MQEDAHSMGPGIVNRQTKRERERECVCVKKDASRLSLRLTVVDRETKRERERERDYVPLSGKERERERVVASCSLFLLPVSLPSLTSFPDVIIARIHSLMNNKKK